jgi:choline dehydrogenase-like flavoprotein
VCPRLPPRIGGQAASFSRALALIIAAPFSAIMIVGALVFVELTAGSSSINGLIYIRSQPEDYDYWAQLGNRGWGWDDVLPFFKRAERWTGEAAEIHGTEGRLTTSPIERIRPPPHACRRIPRDAPMRW